MQRRKVQQRQSSQKIPRLRSSKPPVAFAEMVLNWIIIILAMVILLFLASLVFKFLAGKKSPPVAVVPAVVQPVETLRAVPRVEVLNGCGVKGIAAQFSDYLRGRGFDVVNTDNYRTSNVEFSFIVDRVSPNSTYGKKLAVELGISLQRVQTLISEELDLEATLVLGKDYRSLTGYSGNLPVR